jgi:IS5 family transposase
LRGLSTARLVHDERQGRADHHPPCLAGCWQDARERTDARRLTDWGKRVYARRKETVERSFADAKPLFGHRYARFRGLVRVQCQCLMAAAAQNIKKIALWAATRPAPAA